VFAAPERYSEPIERFIGSLVPLDKLQKLTRRAFAARR
jgi:hypothetical protein